MTTTHAATSSVKTENRKPQPRAVAAAPRAAASAEPQPALKLAVAGAASLSLLAGAVPDALATTSPALDASALYQKVEPQRASKSRFAGTEAEALKNKKLGKASAPAPKAAASTAGSTAKTSKKVQEVAAQHTRWAVIALGGKTRNGTSLRGTLTGTRKCGATAARQSARKTSTTCHSK